MHIRGVIRVSPAQKPLKQSQNGSIYRPQFIEIKSGGTRLDCVQYLTHETEKQQALGKHHYDDSEIARIFDFRAQWSKVARNALALRAGA